MVDVDAITVWRFDDAPADLSALAVRPTDNDWLALVPRIYADDLWWLEHMDARHDPEVYPHPSLSEYQVWIGRQHG